MNTAKQPDAQIDMVELKHAAILVIAARRKLSDVLLATEAAKEALHGLPTTPTGYPTQAVRRAIKKQRFIATKARGELHLCRVTFNTILKRMKAGYHQRNMTLDGLVPFLGKIGFKHNSELSAQLRNRRRREAKRHDQLMTQEHCDEEVFVDSSGVHIILEVVRKENPDGHGTLRLVYIGNAPQLVYSADGKKLEVDFERGSGYLPWNLMQSIENKDDILAQGRIVLNKDIFGFYTTCRQGLETINRIGRYLETIIRLSRAIPLITDDRLSRKSPHPTYVELAQIDVLVDAVVEGKQLYVCRVISDSQEYNTLLPLNAKPEETSLASNSNETAWPDDMLPIAAFP